MECLYQGVPLKFINEAAKECGMEDGRKEVQCNTQVWACVGSACLLIY